jgi:hypothetical protein
MEELELNFFNILLPKIFKALLYKIYFNNMDHAVKDLLRKV